jgi:phosphatidylserine/phosphatidylglycerophosphate/cardiolipin synthase-like enzyme
VATLIDAEQRGVEVRLIVNETQDEDDVETYTELANAGVEIRYSNGLYIHSKTMIFDSAVTFIGSQNPTTNSFENNREVGLVVDDPIVLGRVRAVFARDWAISSPASPKRASPHDISY